MSKIPENAKLVHKGILFDVYNWEQEMFDGSYRTFEAIKRLPSTQIIPITKDKTIIVLEEEQPFIGKFLSIPGGHVERNENPEENAKKELMEETGIVKSNLELWKVENFGSKITWETYYYIAKNCIVEEKNHPEVGEKINILELNFEKFIEFTQHKNFRNKKLKNDIFRIMHDEVELNNFKQLLFN